MTQEGEKRTAHRGEEKQKQSIEFKGPEHIPQGRQKQQLGCPRVAVPLYPSQAHQSSTSVLNASFFTGKTTPLHVSSESPAQTGEGNSGTEHYAGIKMLALVSKEHVKDVDKCPNKTKCVKQKNSSPAGQTVVDLLSAKADSTNVGVYKRTSTQKGAEGKVDHCSTRQKLGREFTSTPVIRQICCPSSPPPPKLNCAPIHTNSIVNRLSITKLVKERKETARAVVLLEMPARQKTRQTSKGRTAAELPHFWCFQRTGLGTGLGTPRSENGLRFLHHFGTVQCLGFVYQEVLSHLSVKKSFVWESSDPVPLSDPAAASQISSGPAFVQTATGIAEVTHLRILKRSDPAATKSSGTAGSAQSAEPKSGTQQNSQNGAKSLAEREKEYNEARERIFGGSSVGSTKTSTSIARISSGSPPRGKNRTGETAQKIVREPKAPPTSGNNGFVGVDRSGTDQRSSAGTSQQKRSGGKS
ncbi:hypothetical protein BJ742DRAFT_735448 [Cladochytrium replicatum]|nr:hypothetical protein BJ742DRAFT_735448 [Cladochytrium replicatum]